MVTRAANRQNKHHQKAGKKPQNNKATGFVRIIAGFWKGKKLPVQDIQGLRPTTDRVKETVFNWLMFKIADRKVLDCFAGSGSLGFEALSRGAAQLTLLEKDKMAAHQLNQNAKRLNSDAIEIHHTDSLNFLSKHKIQYDLVFIDPPFRQSLAEKTCLLLEEKALLSKQALIYLEVESELNQQIWPENWQLLKEKTAGQVCCRLFQRS